MKKNRIYIGVALCLAAVLGTGCKDANYDTIDNGLYIKEAFDSKGLMSSKITVDAEDVTVTLTPSLSRMLGADVNVRLEIDQTVLDSYNEANASSYQVLPAEYYTMPSEGVIQAGFTSGESMIVTVKPFESEDGAQYALPLRVVSSQVGSLPTSSKYLVLCDKPLIQSTPYMNYRSHLKCEPLDEGSDNGMAKTWGLNLSEWSLEFWVWMDGYAINNQALFDSDEIYIRFGDAMIDYDLLQIKLRGTQVNTVTHFSPNTWTHVAFTYDTAGLLTIYVNGVKDVTLQTKGGAVPVNYLQMVCSGVQYFRNNCMMAQIRFWNKCITASQIESNRFYSITPTDDMVGYWRMDEGSGDICSDCTKNGRHAHASASLTWRENQRFDGK